MKTMEHATLLAELATGALFANGDPFNGEVDKTELNQEIANQLLKKLVVDDSDMLTESEFQDCVNAVKKPKQNFFSL